MHGRRSQRLVVNQRTPTDTISDGSNPLGTRIFALDSRGLFTYCGLPHSGGRGAGDNLSFRSS